LFPYIHSGVRGCEQVVYDYFCPACLRYRPVSICLTLNHVYPEPLFEYRSAGYIAVVRFSVFLRPYLHSCQSVLAKVEFSCPVPTIPFSGLSVHFPCAMSSWRFPAKRVNLSISFRYLSCIYLSVTVSFQVRSGSN